MAVMCKGVISRLGPNDFIFDTHTATECGAGIHIHLSQRETARDSHQCKLKGHKLVHPFFIRWL